MKNPRTFRLALAHGIVASALLASSVSALTPDEIYSLRAKAEKGNAIAQYNLGLAFADKREPIYNPAQAYAWLSLASASGTTSKALSDLTNSMTPEQIVAGKARLAELSSSPAASPISAASAVSPITSADSPIAPSITAEAAPDQKKLSAELSAAWEENQLLKTSLNAQLADANKRIAIAEAALANKDKQITSLEARLNEAASVPTIAPAPTPAPVNTPALAELASLRAERDQLQAASASVTNELATLRVNAARQANDQSVLAAKLDRANESLAETRRAQNLAESEATSLKAAADRATTDRQSLAAQLETARNELDVAKAAAVAAAAQAATANAAALAAQNAAANVAAAPVVPVTAPAAVPVNNDELIAIKADRDRFAETAKSLAEERDTLVAQLAVAKATIPAVPAPATTVAPIPTTPETPAITPERVAELEKAKEESDSKLSAALRSYTLQQAEIERLQHSLSSIDGERAALASKLETARSDSQGLRLQAEAAGSATVEANSLRAQLADLKATSTTQAAALARSEQALADARRTVDAATTDLISTRDLLRQTQAQSAAFANENQQLKTRIALAGNIGSPNPSRPTGISSIAVSVPTATAPSAGSATSTAATTPTASGASTQSASTTTTAATPAPVTPIGATAMAIPRIHTVGTGDTLSKISKQYYFTAARWNDILQANRDVIKNPNALTVGTKLRIP